MAKYITSTDQNVALNNTIPFNIVSIPCNKGFVYHEDNTGIFTLRGMTPNRFARYQIVFNGNATVPDGGTAGPIAVAISVNGEPRPTSRAITVPAAVGNYGNLTSTCIVTVPCGCCFTCSVRSVPASEDPTVTPAPVIQVQNANLVITRVA